jgi:hypothetical protein
MKAIAEVAFNAESEENDSFGINDEDWNIYLSMVSRHSMSLMLTTV